MRSLRLSWLVLAGLVSQAAPLAAHAQTVTASAPVDLSVTVYRNPYRAEGGINLGYLGGFGFITETRRVTLQPGDQTLRFEGVADGIDPATAIVTGLPSDVVEKNRDAKLLSPSALVEMAQAQGGRVVLMRTDERTGVSTRTEGVIRSSASGVVFETEEGVEALRCSGFAESFSFEASTTGLTSTPTLSIRTRVTQPIEAVVQLSYLANGFDWGSDYVADRTPGAKSLHLGGWITLANSNGVSFRNARVQVVAGRLNRQTGQVDPIDFGRPIFAQCWPQGRTSDGSPAAYLEMAGDDYDTRDRVVVTGSRLARDGMVQNAPVAAAAFSAEMAEQEDLGDLKLYRIPNRTDLLSRQSKQVRLLDQPGIPVTHLYEGEFSAASTRAFAPLTSILRTKNDKKNNLGLPLPSGRLQLFETMGRNAEARRLLAGETTLRDLTINEEVELRFNGGPDVQGLQVRETAEVTKASPALRFIRGVLTRERQLSQIYRIELTNARSYPVQVEARLTLAGTQEVVTANHTVEQKNGRPIFRVTVPANDTLVIRYQTAPRVSR